MPLINVVLILVLIGLALWAANKYIPMQSGIKMILNIVVVIFVVVWLLHLLGWVGDISAIRVGR